MAAHGLSERRALRMICMSASALRYQPRPDHSQSLHERTVALTHRYRRYGAARIYLKLRQAVEVVYHKRADRLHAEARLQLKRQAQEDPDSRLIAAEASTGRLSGLVDELCV